jgi:DNA repair protein RecN (Recombination protein N)
LPRKASFSSNKALQTSAFSIFHRKIKISLLFSCISGADVRETAWKVGSGALKESDFTVLGCDEVSMQIQGQIDGPKIALGKGASGGEMSRIMLALEVVIAKSHPVGTYIFDEVDAGVGGKAAIEVGKRLHALSQNAQVIVVTHLPQVAAWADTHFLVSKSSDGTIVASGVTRLSDSARVEEIARMLAGLEGSSSAREHAAELLALRG